MNVIPEDVLLDVLKACLDLSQRALGEIETGPASAPASQTLREDYEALIRRLHSQKSNESVLADQSWEWIWAVKPGLKPIQLYGRLAWINHALLDLL